MNKKKFSKMTAIFIIVTMLMQMFPTIALADSENVALGKTVTGDGVEHQYLVDGDRDTYWTGIGDGNDTITIDL